MANPLDGPQYTQIAADLVPQESIDKYDPSNKIKNGYIYMHIIRDIYRLPQSGQLANKLPRERLKDEGYLKETNLAHFGGK